VLHQSLTRVVTACPGRKYEYVYFEGIQDEMQALRGQENHHKTTKTRTTFTENLPSAIAMHAEWKQAAQKSEMELSASGE
jgi:hypothetical protein